MILAAHSDAEFINKSRSRSIAGAHIFLSENDHKPKLNGPVLTILKIIKTVMVSAYEAEMAALYITAKKMIPRCNTLIEMVWPQPQTPIQTDHSTSLGFTNKTIVNKATKSADTNCGGSKKGNHKNNSGTIGRKDLKMKEIKAKSIILQYIMKLREQIHTWYNLPFLQNFPT